MGRYVVEKNDGFKRTASEISVQQPNQLEVVKLKKVIEKTHPLKAEEPKTWNNIPPCIQTGFSNII